ncbi:MAG: hypothetical protein WDW38_000176 [Sanguina aurantia]
MGMEAALQLPAVTPTARSSRPSAPPPSGARPPPASAVSTSLLWATTAWASTAAIDCSLEIRLFTSAPPPPGPPPPPAVAVAPVAHRPFSGLLPLVLLLRPPSQTPSPTAASRSIYGSTARKPPSAPPPPAVAVVVRPTPSRALAGPARRPHPSMLHGHLHQCLNFEMDPLDMEVITSAVNFLGTALTGYPHFPPDNEDQHNLRDPKAKPAAVKAASRITSLVDGKHAQNINILLAKLIVPELARAVTSMAPSLTVSAARSSNNESGQFKQVLTASLLVSQEEAGGFLAGVEVQLEELRAFMDGYEPIVLEIPQAGQPGHDVQKQDVVCVDRFLEVMTEDLARLETSFAEAALQRVLTRNTSATGTRAMSSTDGVSGGNNNMLSMLSLLFPMPMRVRVTEGDVPHHLGSAASGGWV